MGPYISRGSVGCWGSKLFPPHTHQKWIQAIYRCKSMALFYMEIALKLENCSKYCLLTSKPFATKFLQVTPGDSLILCILCGVCNDPAILGFADWSRLQILVFQWIFYHNVPTFWCKMVGVWSKLILTTDGKFPRACEKNQRETEIVIDIIRSC